MFKLFAKKEDYRIVSPIGGDLISIENVRDDVFSSRMMGDGFAVIPDTTTVVSPVSGKVAMVFPTKHAVGITCDDGLEVIIHIGINTVELNGKGFTSFIKVGDDVGRGQKLVKIDGEMLENSKYDFTVIVVFTKGMTERIELKQQYVNAGEGLIK